MEIPRALFIIPIVEFSIAVTTSLMKSDFGTLEVAIKEAIFTYNNFRIHGSLNGRTPSEVHDRKKPLLDSWLKEIAVACPWTQAA